jgi:hypothetical protein
MRIGFKAADRGESMVNRWQAESGYDFIPGGGWQIPAGPNREQRAQ